MTRRTRIRAAWHLLRHGTLPTDVAAEQADDDAFTIDDPGHHLRAFWVTEHDTPYLAIEGDNMPSGDRLYLPLWQITALASLLTAASTFSEFLAVPTPVVTTEAEANAYLAGMLDGIDGSFDLAIQAVARRTGSTVSS